MAKKDKAGKAATDAPRTAAPRPGKSEPLEDRQVLRISKAIADPRRMALLQAIARKPSSCADLRSCSPISAATLSHHMKELETAGLIATCKTGRTLNATLEKKTWKSYISALKAFGD